MKNGRVLVGLLLLVLGMACGGDGNEVEVPTAISVASSPTPEVTVPSPTSAPQEASPTPSGERLEGALLRIPAILVEAPVTRKAMDDGRSLPSPDGNSDLVLYDLSAVGLPNGDPLTGNAALAGYLDSGSSACYSGYVPPPCWAVFGSLEELAVGDEVLLLWEGEELTYRVSAFCWAPVATSFDPYLAQTPSQALTLMTAAGYFSELTGGYSHQLIVRAVRDGESSVGLDCFQGSAEPLPTVTPNPEPGHAMEIASVSGSAAPGDEVTVVGKTEPGAECFLSLHRSNGVRALGFNVEAGGSGEAVFTWRIPDHYPAEEYTVEVGCGDTPQTAVLVVE